MKYIVWVCPEPTANFIVAPMFYCCVKKYLYFPNTMCNLRRGKNWNKRWTVDISEERKGYLLKKNNPRTQVNIIIAMRLVETFHWPTSLRRGA